MKTCIFTFDYELFLGAKSITSGNVDSCLIEPTNEIIKLFKEYKISKSIFFVDTLYLFKLQNIKTLKAQLDFQKIINQLKYLIDLGHYIYPHIHPHWIEAKYIETINQWEFNSLAKYRFSNLNNLEKEKAFEDTFKILEIIYETKLPEYFGYRAGGWCIQPFDDFKFFFDKYNIKCDFSVIPNKKLITHPWNFDFTLIKSKVVYKFSDDITKANKQGLFYSYPISYIQLNCVMNFVLKIINWFFELNNNQTAINETQVVVRHELSNQSSIYKLIKRIFNNTPVLLSFENLSIINTILITRYIRKNDFNHFISHPKLINSNNLYFLNKLLKSLSKLDINYSHELLMK